MNIRGAVRWILLPLGRAGFGVSKTELILLEKIKANCITSDYLSWNKTVLKSEKQQVKQFQVLVLSTHEIGIYLLILNIDTNVNYYIY